MKTTRYRFEKYLESAGVSENKEWLVKEFANILESDKDYTTKCDYIAMSILALDSKIDSIDDEINELKKLKSNLKLAKEISCEVGAKVLQGYGIDKLEGLRVSSITITEQKTTTKTNLFIYDKEALIKEGFYKVVLDEEAIKLAFATDNEDSKKLIAQYCDMKLVKEVVPAKLRINKRKGVNLPNTFDEIANETIEANLIVA